MNLPYNAPLSRKRTQEIINCLILPDNANVLDIGCGESEFLLEIRRKHKISGLGIDIDGNMINTANFKAAESKFDSEITFQEIDARKCNLVSNTYDLIICVGAEYIWGSYIEAIKQIKGYAKTNGYIVLGTIFWKKEPNKMYLELMN